MSKNFQKVMAKIMESKGSNILHFCLLNQCVLNNSAIPFIPSKIRKNTAILVDKKFTLKKYSWFIYLISNCKPAATKNSHLAFFPTVKLILRNNFFSLHKKIK